MKNNKIDVVIIGGGLIGLCLANFMGKVGIKVIILDRNKITSKEIIKKDFRTTAISEGSKNILDFYGFWTKIKKHSQFIKKIKIYDRKVTNFINFKNPDENKNLGYIVENHNIKRILIREILSNKNITLEECSEVKNIENSESSVTIKTSNKSIEADLLIAADGKNSYIRKILNQKYFYKKYSHKAIVINFSHIKNHNATAYEIFYNSGPLALLPMLKNKNGANISSLVFSNKKKFIESLENIDNKMLLPILDEYVEKHIGKVNTILNKQTFPLSAHINNSFFQKRVIYVGDSAHSIHPIAGQGWNLGMRDVDELIKILIDSKKLGIDLGSDYVCKKYNDKRYFDVFSLYQITDKLNSIFMIDDYFFNKFRHSGVGFINSNKKINNFISKYAMGKRL